MSSAIISRGRRGSNSVQNHLWEDLSYDPFELRIAGWLASHADGYVAEHVTRNEIARRTGISPGKVTDALKRLVELNVIEVETISVAQKEGGKRLRVTFDFDVWEGRPRSPGDRGPGHVTTTPRSPGDHISTSVEEQASNSATASPGKAEPTTERVLAEEIVNEWWEALSNTKGMKWIAFVKIAERLLLDGWSGDELRAGIKATTFRTKELEAWKRAQASPAEPVGPAIPADIVKGWNEVKHWVHGYRPEVAARGVDVMIALTTLRRWGYGGGESLIRLALAVRYAPMASLCWDPKYLADDQHRVTRFGCMPQDLVYEGETTLIECMEKAYNNQRWGK